MNCADFANCANPLDFVSIIFDKKNNKNITVSDQTCQDVLMLLKANIKGKKETIQMYTRIKEKEHSQVENFDALFFAVLACCGRRIRAEDFVQYVMAWCDARKIEWIIRQNPKEKMLEYNEEMLSVIRDVEASSLRKMFKYVSEKARPNIIGFPKKHKRPFSQVYTATNASMPTTNSPPLPQAQFSLPTTTFIPMFNNIFFQPLPPVQGFNLVASHIAKQSNFQQPIKPRTWSDNFVLQEQPQPQVQAEEEEEIIEQGNYKKPKVEVIEPKLESTFTDLLCSTEPEFDLPYLSYSTPESESDVVGNGVKLELEEFPFNLLTGLHDDDSNMFNQYINTSIWCNNSNLPPSPSLSNSSFGFVSSSSNEGDLDNQDLYDFLNSSPIASPPSLFSSLVHQNRDDTQVNLSGSNLFGSNTNNTQNRLTFVKNSVDKLASKLCKMLTIV